MTTNDLISTLTKAVQDFNAVAGVSALNEYYRARLHGAAEPMNGDWIADRCAAMLVALINHSGSRSKP